MRSEIVVMMSIITIITIPGKMAVAEPNESDVLHGKILYEVSYFVI